MIKKLLFSLYWGFIAFSLITLFSGSLGLYNMRALDYFKVNVVNHVDDLKMKNSKLNDEINRLSSDVDRLKVAARPLGYVDKGEHMIKIVNSSLTKDLYSLDYQYEVPTFKQKNGTILLVSSMIAVVLFVISLFVEVLRSTFKRT